MFFIPDISICLLTSFLFKVLVFVFICQFSCFITVYFFSFIFFCLCFFFLGGGGACSSQDVSRSSSNTDSYCVVRTVFDIDIDDFDNKPWRHPGVDVSSFFNFGLDEEKWKNYCKQMASFKLC